MSVPPKLTNLPELLDVAIYIIHVWCKQKILLCILVGRSEIKLGAKTGASSYYNARADLRTND